MAARHDGHSGQWRAWSQLLLLLAVGLTLGGVSSLILQWLTPSSVSTEQYAAVVAAAYARERLPLIAVERLTAAGVGDPAQTVAQAAQNFRRRPDRARDAANLEQLADVLKAQTTKTSSGESGQPLGWISVLLLVVGGIVVALRLSRRKPPRRVPGWQTLPQVQDPDLQQIDLVGGMAETMPPERDGESGRRPQTVVGRASTTAPTRIRLSQLPGGRRETSLRPFVCSYHAGDEPFEDVHPVLDDASNTLLGACGLTAAAKLETSSPARYYAFTAWVHDYLSGEPMRAIGLLSPWASGRKRIPLYDPTLTQATLYRTEKGLHAQMETANMLVSVDVSDVGFGTAREVPANSYFTILLVRFEVTLKSLV